ncbi:MAG: FAD-binding protein [Verrucomicrobiaceae bacterium]|nr:MAG: FAD-binding protein [Verrucomicrobiaceae bacterium]
MSVQDYGAGDEFDVIVLGAGISGLVSSSIVERQGAKSILVVDEYPHVGGNHIDQSCGSYTFDIGSFIFQSDSPLLGHFPEMLPHYLEIAPTFGRLNPQGVVAKYPLSVREDLVNAGPLELCRILASVVYARLFYRKLKNAHSFARYWIGERLLKRSGLEHYMQRFYGVDATQIDLNFARKRMLWIQENASILAYVRRLNVPRRPARQHGKQLARPREGFAPLYAVAKQQLEARRVSFLLGQSMAGITRVDGVFRVEVGGDIFRTRRLISTIPIRRIQELCGLVPEDRLQTVKMISLFFSFSGKRGFLQSILFNFSHGGAWKRLTMYSDFYGTSQGREFFAVEVNAAAVGDSVDRAETDFRQHIAANGLFGGDLKLEGSHSVGTAYPIYTNKASERADAAIKELRDFGIESLGRQGAFDYQPTVWTSTIAAETTLARGSG